VCVVETHLLLHVHDCMSAPNHTVSHVQEEDKFKGFNKLAVKPPSHAQSGASTSTPQPPVEVTSPVALDSSLLVADCSSLYLIVTVCH
jgi:hypothetical protein